MRRFALIAGFLISLDVLGATTTIYVDPDASGSGTGADWTNAYTSLNAMVTGEAGDMSGDDVVVEVRSSSGTADTTAADITGFSNYTSFVIQASGINKPVMDGYIDTSKYRMTGTAGASNAGLLALSDASIVIDGLQFETSAQYQGVAVKMVGNNTRVRNSQFLGPDSSSQNYIVGIYGTGTYYVYNNYIRGQGSSSVSIGVHIDNGSSPTAVYIENLSVGTSTGTDQFGSGIRAESGVAGVVYVKNVALFAANWQQDSIKDVTDGNITYSKTTKTDDNDPTWTDNTGCAGSIDVSSSFVARDSDWQLASGDTVLKDAGTNSVSSGHSDDANGDTRSGSWDIGADEYAVVVGDSAVPVVLQIMGDL